MKRTLYLKVTPQGLKYMLYAILWCWQIWYGYIVAVIQRIPVIGGYLDFLPSVVCFAVVLLALRHLKVKTGDIVCFFVIILVCILSYIFFPDTRESWESSSFSFLVEVLPLYFLGLCLGREKSKSEEVIFFLYKLSIATIIVRIIYYAMGGGMQFTEAYHTDMAGAYRLLPHLCLVMYYVLTKRNIWNTVIWCIGSVFLLFQGTRGAVLIEVLCFALMVLLFANWKYKLLKVALISIAVITFIYGPLFEIFMRWLYSIANEVGLSVRIFDAFFNGNITSLSKRDIISSSLFDALAENPWGYGIYGDRPLANAYAHNICLELWIHFGVLSGTIISIFVLFVPIRAFVLTKCKDMKGFLLVLYGAGIMKLFISGSYLQEQWLFFLIGLSVQLIRENRKEKRNINVPRSIN